MAGNDKPPVRHVPAIGIEWFTVRYRTVALRRWRPAAAPCRSSAGPIFGRRTPPAAAGHGRSRPGRASSRSTAASRSSARARSSGCAATRAMVLQQNDLVRTRSGGTAEIRFADGTLFNVRPDSLITIEESTQNPVSRQQRVALSIQSGRGELPDRRAGCARQHDDLDADRAHDRASATRAGNIQVEPTAARPACGSSAAPARRRRERPEDHARLERGREGRRRRRGGRQDRPAVVPQLTAPPQPDGVRVPRPRPGHHAAALERRGRSAAATA